MRRALLVLSVLAAACRSEADRERQEKRALEESISQSQDSVHKLNMKELEGTELSAEELATRQRLKEQAEEDQNGGNAPPPPQAPPETAEEGG
ncbi:MAG: hypothetical protein FD126_2599 [Elusimicrobia bacterium]|nr:MAG: hypothetical protein FD126_2599 [Elusimicrobiota bacterium]